MSRLDYATIIIVVICLVAAGFLLYKTYGMFSGDKQTETPATDPFSSTQEEEDPYYYDTPSTNSDTITYEDEPATSSYGNDDTPSSSSSTRTTTPQSYDNAGDYMVLAGTFSNVANAENFARRLRNQGYTNARTESFDRGSYAVVLVDRFSDYSDASALVNRLRNDGIEAYVKRKQGTTARGVKE